MAAISDTGKGRGRFTLALRACIATDQQGQALHAKAAIKA